MMRELYRHVLVLVVAAAVAVAIAIDNYISNSATNLKPSILSTRKLCKFCGVWLTSDYCSNVVDIGFDVPRLR